MNGEECCWVEEQGAHLMNYIEKYEEISEIHLIRIVCIQKRPVFEVTIVREIKCFFGLYWLGLWKTWNYFIYYFSKGLRWSRKNSQDRSLRRTF